MFTSHRMSLVSKLLLMCKIKSILTIFAVLLLMAACGNKKDDTQPETPRDELIIGTWKSVLHRQDGNVVTGQGYREFEFREDSIALIEEFEEDGTSIDDIEDNWALVEDDERIDFGIVEDHDIIRMTTDSMTLEYDRPDPFSGDIVRHSDDFLKQ